MEYVGTGSFDPFGEEGMGSGTSVADIDFEGEYVHEEPLTVCHAPEAAEAYCVSANADLGDTLDGIAAGSSGDASPRAGAEALGIDFA